MNKRIFIALDISEEARDRIAEFSGELKRDFSHLRVGWEKPEKIHLTLKFLGDIDEKQLFRLSEAVKRTAADFTAFALRMENTGCFPSRKKAKILWTGLTDESGNLQKLQKRLEEEAGARGFEKENRLFKPHLTIARLREPERSGELAEAFLQKQFEPVSFEVPAIVIYESKLQPAGSVYSVIERQKLK
jgi:2'-5' RNA ligase